MRYLKNESKRYVFWFLILAALALLCIAGILLTPAPAHAGTTLQEISRNTTLVRLRGDIDAKRIYNAILEGKIAEQKAEAKRNAENVLSADDLRKIKDQADRVLEEARRFVQALRDNQDGAMVICSSQIVEN